MKFEPMCICEELFRLVLDAIQKKIQNNIGFNKREVYLSYMKLFLSSLTFIIELQARG